MLLLVQRFDAPSRSGSAGGITRLRATPLAHNASATFVTNPDIRATNPDIRHESRAPDAMREAVQSAAMVQEAVADSPGASTIRSFPEL
jgi:hypothetical protein